MDRALSASSTVEDTDLEASVDCFPVTPGVVAFLAALLLRVVVVVVVSAGVGVLCFEPFFAWSVLWHGSEFVVLF